MKYIEISQLVVHPRNVRARSEYREESLASLAASIKALGLLQSLVAQQLEDGSYGVLAGRRRLMAMERLQAEGALAADFKAPCKVIGKDVDHVTALSLAENAMQEPMDPIDEYEAFAAMVQEGDTPEGVAAAFGTTMRAVKERLRFGLVHPAIRDAVRQRVISIDALKAYAGHPCPVTQKRVFDALAAAGTTQAAWTIRQTLEKEHLRADDPLARFVMEAYRARGGAIIAGLFEEDTVLEDRALAEACRDDLLVAQAEAIRAAHGFAWAEIRVAEAKASAGEKPQRTSSRRS